MGREIVAEVAIAPGLNLVLKAGLGRAGVEQDRIQLFHCLFLVAANRLGQRVLDGQVVVQKLTVGIGHNAFGVLRLRGLQRRCHARIVGISIGS